MPVAQSPGCIEPDAVYSLDEFRRRTGWGVHAVRTARRNGLRIIYTGGRAFVRGSDFLRYLDELENTDDPRCR